MKLTELSKGCSAIVRSLNLDSDPGHLVRVANQGFGLRRELTELIEVAPCE